MVKVSKIYRIVVILVLMYMLRIFDLLFYSTINAYRFPLNIIVVIIGLLMAMTVLRMGKKNVQLREKCFILNRYMVIYTIIIIIEVINTFFSYRYSINDTLSAYMPYGYIFYAYPIVYIFHADNSLVPLLKRVLIVVLLMLAVKALSWGLYLQGGIILFPSVLEQYSGWARGGVVRLDTSYLFGIAFSVALYYSFISRKKRYLLIVVLMYLFAIFITQFRFLLGVMIIETGLLYYVLSLTKTKKTIRFLVLTVIIGVFFLVGGLDYVVGSFSTTGQYRSSTLARIETLLHYWALMINKSAVLGLGAQAYNNSTTASMMFRTATSSYWLEDLGIVGGFFRFGVLTLPLYGSLFYYALKTMKGLRRCSPDNSLMISYGTISYMLISCIMLNIFDSQRAFNVPFDLAIISYVWWRTKHSDREEA